jgi:hypothetical protein
MVKVSKVVFHKTFLPRKGFMVRRRAGFQENLAKKV